jgi:hypothetical protein
MLLVALDQVVAQEHDPITVLELEGVAIGRLTQRAQAEPRDERGDVRERSIHEVAPDRDRSRGDSPTVISSKGKWLWARGAAMSSNLAFGAGVVENLPFGWRDGGE